MTLDAVSSMTGSTIDTATDSGADNIAALPCAALRPPEVVMRLQRMGSFYPTRLSFMRTMIRKLVSCGSTVTRPLWEIDADGFGQAIYSTVLDDHTYSLVAFSAALDSGERTDRVIAKAWDTTYVLFDGVPAEADLDRLKIQTPLQEAGRFTDKELVLCRANKSVRLFEHVVECLADGRQPDQSQIRSTGYLMRTTAVYGNGKFGIADRACICGRPAMSGPFQAELLSVWLMRGFTHDLVEHIARARAPSHFVPLAHHLKRFLGIGNATGLGMAPFLVGHPILIHNWMLARETAIARVRAVDTAEPAAIARVLILIVRVEQHLQQWIVDDERQMLRIVRLRQELVRLRTLVDAAWLAGDLPWDRLIRLSEHYSLECQELLVALMLEPYGELIDALADNMSSSSRLIVKPGMSVAELKALLERDWTWALKLSFSTLSETHRFWYVSAEKQEPRLGLRHQEPGAELELPLDIARRVQSLGRDLEAVADDKLVAALLLRQPEHRYAVQRVQTRSRYPYGEIQDNLIGEQCLPIDMLRCKLSFFGASRFDPRSDRWTRITLYQGAPLRQDLPDEVVDDWWLPVLYSQSGEPV